MKWIGLTGGIASGKSSVSALLREKGYPVLDADHVAHQALDLNTPTYQQILQHFGPSILTASGQIDRSLLGGLVFENVDALKYLESIIHPFVQSVVKAERKNLQDQGHAFAIYDVPLLYEKQMEDQFDHVVVVYCAPEQQIERLMERNALTREEAQLRLGCQKSIEEKKGLATTVINNTGSYQELSSQVDRWINEFTKSLK